jgi:hypothetical protein
VSAQQLYGVHANTLGYGTNAYVAEANRDHSVVQSTQAGETLSAASDIVRFTAPCPGTERTNYCRRYVWYKLYVQCTRNNQPQGKKCQIMQLHQ